VVILLGFALRAASDVEASRGIYPENLRYNNALF
jgi:hypothetical protein